ncbi:MAG: hypothetical protein ABSB49_01020 [Polyangia bacterium]
MRLSLVLATHRSTNTALSRICEWASLDPARFEFVVRDNSEDERKRSFLSAIDSGCMRLHFVKQCPMGENMREALALATGDFVFLVSDDDWLSTRGLTGLYEMADSIGDDRSVGCLIGDYLVESRQGSCLFRYCGLDAVDRIGRIGSYLKANSPNMLNYCAARREYGNLCKSLFERFPYQFSFDDQLVSLLYLTLGRVAQVRRVVYGYDLGEWETTEKALAKDRSFYVDSGLPAEYDRLHYLLLGLEGALLLQSKLVAERVAGDNSTAASLWFKTMYWKFAHYSREVGYEQNAANAATQRLKESLAGRKEVEVRQLLLDVCETFRVCDPAGAQRYFDFWSSL